MNNTVFNRKVSLNTYSSKPGIYVGQTDGLESAHTVPLTNELRIFPSPWHWCVHGQGIGQRPTGFEIKTADLILEISLSAQPANDNSFHIFTHSLVQDIIAVCSEKSARADKSNRTAMQTDFYRTIALLPTDPCLYARACAVMVESLVKLGKLESYDSILHNHMNIALKKIEALAPVTNKDRYEKLLLLANLFAASGQAGWTNILTSQAPHGISRIHYALLMTQEITDLFYRGRAAAMLITVVSSIGYGYIVCGDRPDYLRNLLDVFDEQLDQLATIKPDGVHANYDYSLFPLSLTLNSIAILGQLEYLHYRRDWVQQATTYFTALSPESRTSQMIFYVHALSNLGMLEVYVPDLGVLLRDTINTYLREADRGTSMNHYLRCTYLILMAHQFGYEDVLPSKLWNILAANLIHFQYSASRNSYGSGYMIAAYALSAFNAGKRLDTIPRYGIDLPTVVASIRTTTADIDMNLPKLDFALINAALQLRPTHGKDTRFFSEIKFPGEAPIRQF